MMAAATGRSQVTAATEHSPRFVTAATEHSPRPKTPVHDFSQGGLQFGARIDFYRGTAADDLMNKRWQHLCEQLPRYRAYMKRHQGPTSTPGIGNALDTQRGKSSALPSPMSH